MRSNLQENFYKRLKELGGVNKSSNNPSASLSNSTLIDFNRSSEGVALGIVKENHNYFIKTSSKKTDKLGAEDFAYIGGVENKYKYQYNSLAEAEKNRNFYIKTLNESASKQFKKISVSENEDIGKAQPNGDKLKADKAQDEANKNMKEGGAKLATSAKEVDDTKESSAKPIVAKKEAGKVKVVDATKESSAKAISVDKKQVKPKVVKENFMSEAAPEEEMPAPAAPEMGGAETPAEGGDETADLDAAAGALADMGAAEEPAAGGDVGAEMPAEEPASDMTDDMPTGDGEVPTEAEASVKDIEKLTGKVTQKIRSTVLTPEMTKGFIKSYLASFEDKINDLDHEDRKELANAILKDKEENGLGDDSESGADVSADAMPSMAGDEEAEIEEAINQHLAEMGVTGEAEPEEEPAGMTFENYMSERGYSPEKVDEISLMEMVGLVNGYTNECGEEGDAEGMSNYVTSDVSDKIAESGNALFEDLMKPFGEKIKKNKNAYASEAIVPSINEEFGEEEEEESPADDFGGESKPEEDAIIVDEPSEEEDEMPTIAPMSEPMGIGTQVASAMSGKIGGEQKSVTVDLKNATVNVTMNEAESKLRKIVIKKIEEALSGKKPVINESKKSALSVMIDELVNEALIERRAAIEKRLARK